MKAVLNSECDAFKDWCLIPYCILILNIVEWYCTCFRLVLSVSSRLASPSMAWKCFLRINWNHTYIHRRNSTNNNLTCHPPSTHTQDVIFSVSHWRWWSLGCVYTTTQKSLQHTQSHKTKQQTCRGWVRVWSLFKWPLHAHVTDWQFLLLKCLTQQAICHH